MSNARILVVDDEADIRDLVQEILTEEGYTVEVAGNAAEARAACAAQLPDLVLLDIWMPDTDGISLLREWQQTLGQQLTVVMMSGHGTVETAVEATRLGALDYVEKPLSLAKLLRTVRSALDEGGASQAGRPHADTAAARARGPQPADARVARPGEAARAARGAGADRRRAGHRTRGIRAVHPFARFAGERPVRHRRCRCAHGRRPEAMLYGIGVERRRTQGPDRAGRARHAVHQRAGGPVERGAAPAVRGTRHRHFPSRRRFDAGALRSARDLVWPAGLRDSRPRAVPRSTCSRT